jgi:DeoR/GlpR family transcriptional regulator of sugar metabolism
LPISPASGTLAERQHHDTDRKAALAHAAIKLVAPGDVVFLDAGSTNLAIARALPTGANLTVLTNTPAIALAILGRVGFEVILVGGILDVRAGAALGAQAVRDVRRIAADICFVGACAADARNGIRAYGFEDAVFKRALVEAGRVVAVVATNEKLGTTAPFEVASAADIDHLVVEADAPASLLMQFEEIGTRVHRATGGGEMGFVAADGIADIGRTTSHPSQITE